MFIQISILIFCIHHGARYCSICDSIQYSTAIDFDKSHLAEKLSQISSSQKCKL